MVVSSVSGVGVGWGAIVAVGDGAAVGEGESAPRSRSRRRRPWSPALLFGCPARRAADTCPLTGREAVL